MRRNSREVEVKNIDLFLKNIKKKINKNWKFVLSGGEPFIHKKFFAIVEGLIKLGHGVDVITNFSAPPKKIIRFLKLTAPGGAILASIREEYINLDRFFKKILVIEKSFPQLRKCFFTTLLVPNKVFSLPQVEKIKKKFFEKGYQFYTQIEQLRYPDQKFLPLSAEQKKLIKRISKKYNLKPFQKQSEFYSSHGIDLSEISHKGQKCGAGWRYFCLTPNGDAFHCWPSRQAKVGYMGNILRKDFKLLKGPAKCPCEACIFTSYALEKSRILDR
jgi:MoaA/NifB/PqqE/SkfB family radical SAM enzyme